MKHATGSTINHFFVFPYWSEVWLFHQDKLCTKPNMKHNLYKTVTDKLDCSIPIWQIWRLKLSIKSSHSTSFWRQQWPWKDSTFCHNAEILLEEVMIEMLTWAPKSHDLNLMKHLNKQSAFFWDFLLSTHPKVFRGAEVDVLHWWLLFCGKETS